MKLLQFAHEQRARRLSIAPSIVWSGGEHLTAAARREIEAAFGAVLIDEYGSSECLSIAVGCSHGWLHLNADWVVLEPVDARYPLRLNTGRLRDQWHGMSRTGKVARMFQHVEGPALSMARAGNVRPA